MDKQARRRSQIMNDSEDVKCVIPRRSELVGKKSSKRNGKYRETSPEPKCCIQQLPSEVLAKIFSYVSSTKGLRLRFVCKKWNDVYVDNIDTKVYFNQCRPSDHFGNCKIRKLSVRFRDVDLGKLPESMWQKIGCKIRTLILESCQVGDQGMKNLIMYCDKLQSLEVLLDDRENRGYLFCSPKMLRELCITRKNLKTFKIIRKQASIDITDWVEKLKAFFKVFTNVTHYTAGYYTDSSEQFRFKFLKELDENDMNKITTILAFSLSTDWSHPSQALDVAATLTLKDISLSFMQRYHYYEDEAMLMKFFSNCNNVKFMEAKLESYPSIELRRLGEDSSETGHIKPCTMWPRLEELSLKLSPLPSPGIIDSFLHGILKNYPNLQHLDIGRNSSCTDEMLQNIFQHLIHLRTLSICITHRLNTNLGITGRHSSPSTSGYSINHLKNLEELRLSGYHGSQLSDEIFKEFIFPKLRSLEVDRPADPWKILPIMREGMPLLEKICFRSHSDPITDFTYGQLRKCQVKKNSWTQSLVPFCKRMNKLFTIMLPYTALGDRYRDLSENMYVETVLNIFKVCPSLRIIKGCNGTRACYFPDTREVRLTNHKGKTLIFFIK